MNIPHYCYIGDNKDTHMWFTSCVLTIDNRLNNIVSYESLIIRYKLIKIYYKQPKHKSVTNTYLPTTNPTIICKEDNTTDATVTDIPAQKPLTTDSSAAPTPQAQDKQCTLTNSILIKYIHQQLDILPDIRI